MTADPTPLTPPADAPDLDNLAARREAKALDLWRAEGRAPSGICPHCGSTVSVVQRDERYVARCSHRGCGARGPQHFRLTSAVDAFCRPPAYVLRHMGVHPSSLINIDEAVELARESLYRGGSDYNECDLNTLARAVLAMADVVAAAREQAAAHERNDWERATNRTEDAIRTLDAEARRG